MKIELYTITWNDMRVLPFFLRHYESWVDRIVVFDDHSDDGSLELLRTHPKVDLRVLPEKGDSFVLTALHIWNHAWKESRNRADWVIATNVDEFFRSAPDPQKFLQAAKEAHFTIVHPLGFEMYGEHFPASDANLIESLKFGVPMFGQDKQQIFNPNAISEMRFLPGRHMCAPQGRLKTLQTHEARLFHYKYVDTRGYLVPRQAALRDRMLGGDIVKGFGQQYRLHSREIESAAAWIGRHALNVVDAVFADGETS